MILAARRVGIREVILPKQNEKNVKEDLNEELRRGLIVHYAEQMDDVLKLALVEPKIAPSPAGHPPVESVQASVMH